MEEIIQILIFVVAMVIAVVGQNAKSKKKPVQPSAGEIGEDIFPDKENTQEPRHAPSHQPPGHEPKAARRDFRRAKPDTSIDTTGKPLRTSPKTTQKIRIGTREEARRAFIHAEIFNRKY